MGYIDHTDNAGDAFALLGQVGAGYNPGYTVYTVTDDDLENERTLCQHIDWTPVAYNDNNTGSSDEVCAKVGYNFNLTPTIDAATVPDALSAGSTVPQVRGTITNSGATRSRNNTIWQLTMVTVPKGVAIPGNVAGGTSSATAPCGQAEADARYNGKYFENSTVTCQNITRGTGGIGGGSSIASVADPIVIDSSLPVGTRVCFALSVRDRAEGDSNWQHSEPRCIVISKQPKVQVLGGDLFVGRTSTVGTNVITGRNTTDNKTYGSWAEYGIVASGTVNDGGMASATGYGGGVDPLSSFCSLSLLSVSNTSGSLCSVGHYTVGGANSVVTTLTQALSPTSNLSGSAITVDLRSSGSTANGIYSLSNDTVFNVTGPVGAGRWIVINAPDKNIRIENNIEYSDGPFSSVSNLPQVVIIAKNIVISDAVTKIDAWLFADETLNTCDAPSVTEPAGLTADVCNKQLTVNGPVSAHTLLLYRTAGAGPQTQSGDPAEVFNTRPDAALWMMYLKSIGTKAQAVVTDELPPRY